jgi:hypothetical protein
MAQKGEESKKNLLKKKGRGADKAIVGKYCGQCSSTSRRIG